MVSKISSHMRGHFGAYLALFFALGGTSIAAVNAVPRNSVGTAQLKNGAVTKTKINKKTITALKGSRGPQGPQGASGSQGPKGDQGLPGTPATKLLAQIAVDGTVNASSPGVTAQRVATGAYHINFGQDITHCTALATQGGIPNFAVPGASSGRVVGSAIVNIGSAGSSYGAGFPSADTVEVDTYNSSGTAADSNFYVAVFC